MYSTEPIKALPIPNYCLEFHYFSVLHTELWTLHLKFKLYVLLHTGVWTLLTGCKEKLSSPCQPLKYPSSRHQVLRKLKQKGPPSISKHNQQLKKTELKPLKKNDTPNPVTVWAIQKNQLHCWQNCKTKHTGWVKHLSKVMNTWTVYII